MAAMTDEDKKIITIFLCVVWVGFIFIELFQQWQDKELQAYYDKRKQVVFQDNVKYEWYVRTATSTYNIQSAEWIKVKEPSANFTSGKGVAEYMQFKGKPIGNKI
jgi:hypothetical protein